MIISSVDVSFIVNKIFHNVNMAFFNSDVQGSLLLERKDQCIKTVSTKFFCAGWYISERLRRP